MYCKNCGKKLPDNARFCDRCNMSVRKMESKMELIEELKAERIARQKAKAVQERYKQMQQKKRRRRKLIILAAVFVLILGFVSGITVYIDYINNSDFNKPDNYENGTVAYTDSPSATAENVSPTPVATPKSGTAAVSPNEDGYIETSAGGVKFAYPRGYDKTGGNGILNLSDRDSSAVITVYQEETSSTAKDIMKTYADKTDGSVTKSIAGDGWYSITVSKPTETRHRAGIISGGKHTYYEITYPAASEKEGEYTESIEYMDSYFTGK